jgi:demethylmenaquinone methyltransferase / 2-methoxy-6-polyprenyl-1,4-benzoquinol methylase
MKKKNNRDFPEYIKANFASITPKYDFLNHLLSFNLDKYWRKKTIRVFDQRKGVLLDLCTGTCDLAITARSELGDELQIFGIDFCKEMLVYGKNKIKDLENIRLIRGDALFIPFSEKTVDCIVIGFGLRNLKDLKIGLKEMNRVLKDEGKLIILEFSRTRVPIFKYIYNFYFRYLLPIIAKTVSGSGDFYKYLYNSVTEFPENADLVDMLEKVGFSYIETIRMTLGVVTIYSGSKSRD